MNLYDFHHQTPLDLLSSLGGKKNITNNFKTKNLHDSKIQFMNDLIESCTTSSIVDLMSDWGQFF